MNKKIAGDDLILPLWDFPKGIYDCHTHVWASRVLSNRFNNISSPAPEGSAEKLIEMMDKNDVIKSLIITPMTLGFDNSITLDISKEYPARFLPIVRINLLSSHFFEVFKELHSYGAKGLRISINNLNDAKFLMDSQYFKLWTFLDQFEIPLFFHCEPNQFHIVSQISNQYPNVRIVIDHMGRISPQNGTTSKHFKNLLQLAQMPNIYVKISSTNHFSGDAAKHSDLVDYIEIILQRFSANRLIWGSDWPFSEISGTYESSYEPLRTMQLVDKRETLQKIFVTNFKELFKCV